MIDHIHTGADGVVAVIDGDELTLSWRWLRDHATDETSYLASTNQRLVDLGTVLDTAPGTVTTDGATMTVTWPTGPTARYEASMLRSLSPSNSGATGRDNGRNDRQASGWDRATIGDRLVTIDYDAVLTEKGRRHALGGLVGEGVILVTAVPLTNDATRAVLERFGYLRTTIFGELWEYSSQPDAGEGYDDTASSTLAITPHTDGTYSHDAPGLLGLHCRSYAATGGENVFIDGRTLAARLEEGWSEDLELLRTVDVPGRYIGDGAHLVASRPPLRYERGQLVQISYNNHDRAPFLLPEPTMSRLYDALHRLDSLAADPELQLELGLRPGEMVLFDNWRLLHGRALLDGTREMAGGYINREDFESAVRLNG